MPELAHGAIVRSTVARGRIASIETTAAERARGVIGVVTHRHAPRRPYRGHKAIVDPTIGERLRVLQGDRVSHQGQPVALVMAETLEPATHAATLVRVAYAPEPATTDITRVKPVRSTRRQPDQGEGRPAETRRRDPAGARDSGGQGRPGVRDLARTPQPHRDARHDRGGGRRPADALVLGASRDGRLAAILHDGHQETSTDEEYCEALLDTSRFLYSCPTVSTRHGLAPMNVGTATFLPGRGERQLRSGVRHGQARGGLNIDPVERRRRNEPGQDEFKKLPFSTRPTRECYRVSAERFGWGRRNVQLRSMRDGRWLIGRGMAAATYPTHYAPASARARVLPEGTAEVASAASDRGPGTWASMTQGPAETLGVPIERVTFTLGDTRLPRAPVHSGSMTDGERRQRGAGGCRRAREDALVRAGGSDLTGAMRRLGHPVEASAHVTPGDAAKRLSMHGSLSECAVPCLFTPIPRQTWT